MNPLKLYGIAEQVRDWAERAVDFATGEILDEQAEQFLDMAQGRYEETILDLACMHKEYRMAAEAIREEEKKLAERRQILERRAEGIKGIIADNMAAGLKLESGATSIGWRKSEQVVLDATPDEMPDWAVRVKREANKSAIKQSIKMGGECDFAHLEQKDNLQIR